MSVATTPSKIALGVGTNLYNLSFINNSTTNTSRPSSVPLGTRDGVPTNAIASQVGYVYLASDTSTAEIAILDTSALPYTQIGLYDAPGNSGADTVFVAGNTGYMTSGNSFQIFDLSAKTGTRSQIGSSVTLANNANGMVVVGSYAYVSLDDSTIQLQIIDISTPASASVVGDAQIES